MIESILSYVVGPVIASVLTWFLARSKYKVEVTGGEIENKKSELDFYKQLLDDNKERLNELLERNNSLEARLEAQQVEINTLRNQLFSWQTKVCMDLTCAYRKSYVQDEQIENDVVEDQEATEQTD